MSATISDAITQINNAILSMKEEYPHKEFTMDGRLVGDIGEVLAENQYALTLYDKVVKDYDAETPDGKKVQIKATFKDVLTLRKTPEYYLGIKIYEDDRFDEIYNGPGRYIEEKLSHRKGYGEQLIPLTNNQLKKISDTIPDIERIPRRINENGEREVKQDTNRIIHLDDLKQMNGKTLSLMNMRGKVFHAEIQENGILVDNLGNTGFLQWEVFEESIKLLKEQKRVLKGQAMTGKLGDDKLPIDSLEGHIALNVYKKEIGSSVFRRITPVANILIWMNVCKNNGQYLEVIE